MTDAATSSDRSAHEDASELASSAIEERVIAVAVLEGEDARQLFGVATRLVRPGGQLLVLRALGPRPAELDEHEEPLPAPELPSDLLRGYQVEVVDVEGPPEAAIREAIPDQAVDLLLLPWLDEPGTEEGDSETRAQRRGRARAAQRLFLEPPCEAWMLVGGLGGRPISSLLVVPSEGEPSARALSAARSLAEASATSSSSHPEVTVLDVHGRGDAKPSDEFAERVDDVLGPVRHEIRSVVAKSRERATIEAAHGSSHDLLVMDVPVEGLVPKLGTPRLPVELVERLDGRPLVIVNRRRGRLDRAWRRTSEWVSRATGALDEQQRLEVYSDLRRGSRADRDFVALTVLSGLIAALGLLIDSGAVIIGAMLVAPFMAPLIALGLAVVFGDLRFMRTAFVALLRGTAFAWLVAVLVGVVIPPSSLSQELVARTSPTGLDMLVALFSGAAGAYAYARKDLSAALPGVAIAAALVPPLVASGIALGAGQQGDAVGAGLLYLMNVVAVTGAAAVVFLWFGFRPELQRFGRWRAFAGSAALIVTLLLMVAGGVYLIAGDDRRAAELAVSVESVVDEWLPETAILRDFETKRSDGAVQVSVLVSSPDDLGAAGAERLGQMLQESLGEPVRVELQVIPRYDVGLDAPSAGSSP